MFVHRMRVGQVNRRGVSLVLFALSLMVLLAFCGATIDVGHWYHTSAKLQGQGDAAALAGCTKLPDGDAAAAAAREYAALNGCTPAEIISVTPITPAGQTSATQFEVVLERVAGPFFTGVIGFQTVKIRTRSLAQATNKTSSGSGVGTGSALDFAVYSGQEKDSRGRDFQFTFAGGGIHVFGDIFANGDLGFQGAGAEVNGSIAAGHDIDRDPAVLTGTKTENAAHVPFPDLAIDTIKSKAKAEGTYYKFTGTTLQVFNPATGAFETPTSLPSGISQTGSKLAVNDNDAHVTGTYYLEGGGLSVSGNAISGSALFVTEGDIQLSANRGVFDPDSTFGFVSLSTSTSAINISATDQTLNGAILAPNGGISLQGNGNTIIGSVMQLNGTNFTGTADVIRYNAADAALIPVKTTGSKFVRLIE